VIELWRGIEAWFAKNLPNADLVLRPPATRDQIAEAEAKLGTKLPDDFVASLLVHDGQEDEPNVLWLPSAYRLGSLASLVACWERDRQSYADDPEREGWLDGSECTRQVHFHPKHVPIAGSRFWDYDRLLLDFFPGPKGRPGQVIAREESELYVIAPSFLLLLEKTLAGLENGRIRFEKRSADIGGEWDAVYLTPRSKKPMPAFRYFE
jgi:cell wall assembly regulator SMI1